MYEVVVIGAGPGGICSAIKLRAAGIEDFLILEKAPGVGGTWWNNRYPGAECDVPSHLYSFSFEPKRDWSRPYARQPEILRYMQHVAEKYDVERSVRFNAEVFSARWEEDAAAWRIELRDGDIVNARSLISGVGMFCKLAYPDIDGRDRFEGTQFHTGDWLDGHSLKGERVAVIGTAASAVQMIPEIVDDVAHLTVYQRRPQWVLPKEDTPFTEDEIRNFVENDDAAAAQRAQIRAGLENFITFHDREILNKAEEAGLRNLEVVEDPEVRAKLTPDMRYGCRRPLSSNLYYPVFNRDNVTLVNEAVTGITANAVLAGGEATEVDTIIYATGFQTTRYLSAIDVYGRDGLSIHDAWADGAQAYLGITTAGFPNLYMIYGPNTNNGSILEMIEHQVDYIVGRLTEFRSSGARWVELKPERMAAYNDALQDDINAVEVWQGACGGYYRGNGGFIVTQWPHTMDEYKARLGSDAGSFESGS